jgi:hypothetical protein
MNEDDDSGRARGEASSILQSYSRFLRWTEVKLKSVLQGTLCKGKSNCLLVLTEIIWLLTSAGNPYHPSTAPKTQVTAPQKTSHAGVCFLSEASGSNLVSSLAQ